MSERERAMEQGSTGLGEGGPRPRERKGPASPIYSVELEVFEGPLDLLLHLVRKHELDILDIPISFVAEKYLEYLDVMRQLDLEIAGDYLVMAATLAYLKSRELLPPEPRSGEAGQSEEEEGEDPREALIRRLVEYERFKQAAAELDSLPVSGRDVFARGAELVMPPIDPGLAPVSLFNLAEAYYRVLTRAKVKSTHEVQIEAVTVAQRIKQLALILDEKPHFEFEELFLNRTWNSERELRAMLVVTLMSILEMVKLGVAGVQQPQDTTTIRIYRRASAQETQQALADYDEDASFGAPKPKEGEGERPPPASPGGPPRTTEAELDAVEEAALLAEALASVQEPEEPVVGYADEGEDVAANDPASEYDDEPRPPQRRSRSESRAGRSDVLEDRAEAFDDELDGRLVIVEGSSAEVPREHDGPRRGWRAGTAGQVVAGGAETADGSGAVGRVREGGEVLEDASDGPSSSSLADASSSADETPTAAGEASGAPASEELPSEAVLEDISAAGTSSAVLAGTAAESGEGLDPTNADARSQVEDVREDAPLAHDADDSVALTGGLDAAESRSHTTAAFDEVAVAADGEPEVEDVLRDTSVGSSGAGERLASSDDASQAGGGSGEEPTASRSFGTLEPTGAQDVLPGSSVAGDEGGASDAAISGADATSGAAADPDEVPADRDAATLADRTSDESPWESTPATGDEAAEEVLGDSLSDGGSEASSFGPVGEVAADGLGDNLLGGGSTAGRHEVAEQMAAAEDKAAEDALGDSLLSGGSETAEPLAEAGGDVLGDSLAAGESETAAQMAAAGDEVAEEVLGDSAGEPEAPEPGAAGGVAGDALGDSPVAGEPEAAEPVAATWDEVAEDVLGDSLVVGGSEVAEPVGAVEGDVLGDSPIAGEFEAAEPVAAGENFEDSLVTGESGVTEPMAVAGLEVQQAVLGDSLVVAESGAAEPVVGGEFAGEAREDSMVEGEPEAAEPVAAGEVFEDSEVVGGVRGDSSAAGGTEGMDSTSAAGAGDAGDVLSDTDIDAGSTASTEAVTSAARETDEASDEDDLEPAGSDASTEDTEDESEPVRSDSDEDEAGGLFLNTGEGLGARELGDVDDDEDDAQ